jgi:hypothetical protein
MLVVGFVRNRAPALFFLSRADVITVAPTRRVLRVVFEAFFVPDLTSAPFAGVAAINIAGAERRRITGQVNISFFFGGRACADNKDGADE